MNVGHSLLCVSMLGKCVNICFVCIRVGTYACVCVYTRVRSVLRLPSNNISGSPITLCAGLVDDAPGSWCAGGFRCLGLDALVTTGSLSAIADLALLVGGP